MSYVRVEFDKAGVKARIQAATAEATPIITNEFIKDANYYCKEDTGVLISSAIRGSTLPAPSLNNPSLEDLAILASAEGSHPEDGFAVWDTPYAKRMYYTGSASHDRNPNASTLWGEKAKRANTKKYQRMAQAIADRRV